MQAHRVFWPRPFPLQPIGSGAKHESHSDPAAAWGWCCLPCAEAVQEMWTNLRHHLGDMGCHQDQHRPSRKPERMPMLYTQLGSFAFFWSTAAGTQPDPPPCPRRRRCPGCCWAPCCPPCPSRSPRGFGSDTAAAAPVKGSSPRVQPTSTTPANGTHRGPKGCRGPHWKPRHLGSWVSSQRTLTSSWFSFHLLKSGQNNTSRWMPRKTNRGIWENSKLFSAHGSQHPPGLGHLEVWFNSHSLKQLAFVFP